MQEKEKEKTSVDDILEEKVVDCESQPNKDDSELESRQEGEDSNRTKSDNSDTLFEKVLNKSVYVALFSFIISISVTLFSDKEPVVEKDKLIKDLSTLISNDADLRAMKFYYNNKNAEKRGLTSLLKSDSSSYISASAPLSSVLEEIRTGYYLSGNDDDKFIGKLESVIKEYSNTNPFDKLNATQKDLFENIRVKLGANYQVVSTDLNKLSDEIYGKNLLVSEYLSDSKTSLFVSIASAFIAVILAGIQMYQGRASKLASSISRALDINRMRGSPHNEHVPYNREVDKIVMKRQSDGREFRMTYFKDGKVHRELVR